MEVAIALFPYRDVYEWNSFSNEKKWKAGLWELIGSLNHRCCTGKGILYLFLLIKDYKGRLSQNNYVQG